MILGTSLLIPPTSWPPCQPLGNLDHLQGQTLFNFAKLVQEMDQPHLAMLVILSILGLQVTLQLYALASRNNWFVPIFLLKTVPPRMLAR